MSQFPELPETLSTRQVECISCREIFVVSEDQYLFAGRKSREWRLAVNGYPETHLRYQPNRGRRAVTPEARAEPAFDYDPLPTPPNEIVYVNCPRCGVDNRNWIKIRYIEKFHTLWTQRWIIGGGVVLALFLAIAAYFAYQGEGDISQRYKSTFFMVVFIAGILPIFIIPRRWRAWRDFKYATPLLKQQSRWEKIPPPVRKSILLFAGLVVGLPLFFFILLPWMLSGLTAVLTFEPQGTLVEQIDQLDEELEAGIKGADDLAVVQVAMNQLNEIGQRNSEACNASNLIPIMSEMERFQLGGVVESATKAIVRSKASLNQLIQNNQSFCNSDWIKTSLLDLNVAAKTDPFCKAGARCQLKPEHLLDVYEEIELLDPTLSSTAVPINLQDTNEVNTVLTSILTLVSQSPSAQVESEIRQQIQSINGWITPQNNNWFTAGVQFLIDWSWFTGLASLISIGIALWATDRYIRQVDEHLPRPVFYSAANMTRIAIWESNRALEIGETIRRIQWTAVHRNHNGGIDLVGLFRDPPEFVDGRLQTKVRAQEYRIQTDRWCKIENATIIDKMVDIPANSPIFVHPPDVLPADIVVPTERPLR